MSAPSVQSHLPGFADPVHDAQRVFRAVLEAMARPTLSQPIVGTTTLRTPAPLGATVGAVVLALCDEQTPIWLDRALAASDDVRAWIRFHTGARLVERPGDALFAVASSPSAAPGLAELAQGSDEEPHLSATLVIDAAGAKPIGAFTATGPGVDGTAAWDGAGLPGYPGSGGFLAQWAANRNGFPRGVDIVLAGAGEVRALPRTTVLAGTENRSA
jgi:alpha-D-ribose 1-methylphosphonate 5-triphosphate synthase subunit PhnH